MERPNMERNENKTDLLLEVRDLTIRVPVKDCRCYRLPPKATPIKTILLS